jgi:hypothetical protein
MVVDDAATILAHRSRTGKRRVHFINLIGSTTTRRGLRIKAELDTKTYVKGIKVSEKEMEEINLTRHEFHGEWNYQISPTIKRPLD